MRLFKRIKLNTTDYYIEYECHYNENGDLKLDNYKDDYYDGGDLSELIDKIQKEYTIDIKDKYDLSGFINDAIYIYDNIPYITGIGDMYPSSIDNIINSASYMSIDELKKIIDNINK